MEYIRTDKIYKHSDRLSAYLKKETVYPVTVEIHLTNRCNIKCHYCMFKDRHDNLQMSHVDALSVIRELADMNVKAVTFSGGGEPTIHSNLNSVVSFTKHLGMDAGLITNGVVLDTFVLNYLTWIRFSVDASDASMYRKIKGVNKFNDVIRNIKRAVAYKQECNLDTTIGFQAILGEENYCYVDEMIELAQTLGVDYFQYRPIERGASQEKPIVLGKYTIPVIDTWYKWEEIKDAKPYTSCPGADFIGAIGADCNYYMCCHHVGDKTASYGHILNGSITYFRKKVQKEFDYSKCPIACRGAVINRRLTEYNKIEHVNFL